MNPESPNNYSEDTQSRFGPGGEERAEVGPDSRPRLAARTRLQVDRATSKPILLFPEGVLALNASGAAIAELCDGRTTAEIVDNLAQRFGSAVESDVYGFLARLAERGLLDLTTPNGRGREKPTQPAPSQAMSATLAGATPFLLRGGEGRRYRPLGLLAELTYKCPLHCPYCSNPTTYPTGRPELSTDEWRQVLAEASEVGVLHVLFSGGEPLLRQDLPELVAAAHQAGAYTNLITSAVGLTQPRALALRDAGLDSVQISFQAHEPILADLVAGAKTHQLKRDAAFVIKSAGFPLTINVVLHRRNVEQIAAIINLAEELGAERLELANVQFYGWAFQNQNALLPTRDQLARAESIAAQARDRLRGRMEVHYILPDYYGDRPKPCMNGWGQRYLTVNPVGDVLPCPTATSIPGLCPENIRDRSLTSIWNESSAFNLFRGTDWMPEPCQSCSLRDIDFGGCRCQSALLTGEPASADPACGLSPFRAKLTDIVDKLQDPNSLPDLQYRLNPV